MNVGVDGCRAGWVAAIIRSHEDWRIKAFPDFTSLWQACQEANVILIDIPIGLLDKGQEGRGCDREARNRLGRPRASSVFAPPCRAALGAKTYEEACNINRTKTGRKISIQTWNILPKIREIDNFLQANRLLLEKRIIRESHPEVAFQALNDHAPMLHNKKTHKGRCERLGLLKRKYTHAGRMLHEARRQYRLKQVQRDDILDAICLAVTAWRGGLRALPASPQTDSLSLPMEIVYSDGDERGCSQTSSAR